MSDMTTTETMLQQILIEQTGMKEQLKGALRRIDEQTKLTESVHELATSVKLLAAQQESTSKKVSKLCDDVDELRQKPVKKWDTAVTCILTAVLGGFIGFVMSRFGMQ